MGVFVCCTACSLFQPTPRVVERNYEDSSVTKSVKIGHDLNAWPPLQETQEHARARLIADISRECPQYKILAEGTQTGSHVESRPELNVFSGKQEMAANSVPDYYLWIRYRCK
jgi:hypothetical protein